MAYGRWSLQAARPVALDNGGWCLLRRRQPLRRRHARRLRGHYLQVGTVGPAVLTTAFAQVGGVGSGLLSEAVIRAWDRLRKHEGISIEQSEFREALAVELREALTSSSPMAAGLRAEVAGVLQRVDAVKVALATTIETTVRESGDQVRVVLIRGLRELGDAIRRVQLAAGGGQRPTHAIAQVQAELAAGSRAMLEAQQQTLMQLALLRRQARAADFPNGRAGATASYH